MLSKGPRKNLFHYLNPVGVPPETPSLIFAEFGESQFPMYIRDWGEGIS